jgi:hypothetical protein
MAREYSSISVATTLNSGINTTATTMTVPSVGAATDLLGGVTLDPGNVDIFTVAIDHDTVNEEIVFVTGVSGDTLTISRGQAGTGTPGVSGIAHNAGASIKHVLTSSDLIFYRDGVATADAAIPKSIIAAKGDILTGTANDTPAVLSVGTNGHTLVANSSTATGLEWKVDPVADLVTTAGDTLYATAADTLARLAIGTAGQVLQVNSGATAPEWVTPASGGMTLLASGPLSSSSTTYNVVTTGYTYLQIFMNNVYATADNVINMRINGDTGSNYALCGITSGVSDNKFASATSYRITAGTGTSNEVLNNANAFIQIFDPNSTSQMAISHQAMCGPSGDMRFNAANGNYDCSAAITSILFLHPTGSFSSGTVSIYGVK